MASCSWGRTPFFNLELDSFSNIVCAKRSYPLTSAYIRGYVRPDYADADVFDVGGAGGGLSGRTDKAKG